MRFLKGDKLKDANRKLFTNGPTVFDAICYSLILLFCYFVFNHSDILGLGGSSFTYLNGHIRDFYDVNKQSIDVCVYFPSIYILFAAWNIPVKLLGIVNHATLDVGYLIFYYKLLTTLFFFGSAYCLYKIGKRIGLNKMNSVLLTLIWISSPILFFSQFVFGQYDIFCTFFVLLGVYYFLKRNIWLFVLFFSISFAFKYFSVFIFIPLLLLIEKKPKKLLLYLIASLIPICLQVLFYMNSAAFRTDVIEYGNAAPRLIASFVNIWPGLNIYLFLFSWFIISGICYYISSIEDKNRFYQTVFYICLCVLCSLFTFVHWHPQWMLFITPFLAVTTFMNKKIKEFLFLDFIMMIAFVGFTVSNWQMNADQQLFQLGILGKFNPDLFDPVKALRMAKIFILGSNLYLTLFSSLLVLNALLKFPNKANRWDGNDNIESVGTYWGYARLRFIGGMAIFIIPAFISYFYALKPMPLLNKIDRQYGTIHNSLVDLSKKPKI